MKQVVLLDIDGVLTDGTIEIDAAGKESKKLSFDDIDAIFELKKKGIKIGFVTGEKDEFTEYIRKRFSPDFFITGCKDKLKAVKQIIVEEKLSLEDVCYLGDSKHDAAVLEFLPSSYAPGDADGTAKSAARVILNAGRGQGAVKELARHILEPVDTPDKLLTARLDEHIGLIQEIRKTPGLLKGITEAAGVITASLKKGGKVLICGNGGSAADAQHIAAEFVNKFLMERPALYAEALTVDTSVLTAIGNDSDYAFVFSRQVEAKGKKGDVLLGISTSGKAKNVLNAILKAKDMGIKTVAFTGQAKTGITKSADYCIAVPSRVTPRIQEAHILVFHLICEMVERELFDKEKK